MFYHEVDMDIDDSLDNFDPIMPTDDLPVDGIDDEFNDESFFE